LEYGDFFFENGVVGESEGLIHVLLLRDVQLFEVVLHSALDENLPELLEVDQS
jgi:hypothetical protein